LRKVIGIRDFGRRPAGASFSTKSYLSLIIGKKRIEFSQSDGDTLAEQELNIRTLYVFIPALVRK